jgi:hypothetical protein
VVKVSPFLDAMVESGNFLTRNVPVIAGLNYACLCVGCNRTRATNEAAGSIPCSNRWINGHRLHCWWTSFSCAGAISNSVRRYGVYSVSCILLGKTSITQASAGKTIGARRLRDGARSSRSQRKYLRRRRDDVVDVRARAKVLSGDGDFIRALF